MIAAREQRQCATSSFSSLESSKAVTALLPYEQLQLAGKQLANDLVLNHPAPQSTCHLLLHIMLVWWRAVAARCNVGDLRQRT
jgi:hypothetical protein